MPSPAYEKFRKSMILDFDAMHDGTGYDMAAFAEMPDEEKQAVIVEIRGKGKGIDWRDMGVLAHDNSPPSFDRLRDELIGGTAEQRATTLGYLFSMKRMGESVYDFKLAQILDDVTDSDGVVASLLRAAEHCGPKTREALLRGTRDRPDVAIHFAAQLLDCASLSKDMAVFDPKFRPTLVKLLPDESPAVRAGAFAQVCKWLEVDPASIPPAQ